MNQFDDYRQSMGFLANLFPDMLKEDVDAQIASGKCGDSCGRDIVTGECAYCTEMEQLLDNGITIEYTDGTSEVLKRRSK
jgi:hypothetical protein